MELGPDYAAVNSDDAMTDGDSPLKELEIRVDNETVSAILRSGGNIEQEPPTCTLRLNPQRKELIDLLSKLLHKAMDEGRSDSLGSDLYRELLQALGRELFDLLLHDKVGELVRQQLTLVGLKQLRLRINLMLRGEHAPWLLALPWEYIHTPHGDNSLGEKGAFLSSEAELILSRRIGRQSRNLGADVRPIKVLFVCASPTQAEGDETPLTRVVPGAMLRTLEELESNGFIKLVKLIDVNPPRSGEVEEGYVWQATSREFMRLVKDENPVLIHFVGHGRHLNERGQLAFSKRHGPPDWVDDEWFAQTAGQLQGLKAVLLQACESAMSDPYVAFSGVALTLASRGIPAVIGMQYRVRADLAETFAQALYRALADDLPIDMAVNSGRTALSGDSKIWSELSFGLPVLYLSQYSAIAQRAAGLTGKQLSTRKVGNGGEWHGACPRCGNAFGAGAVFDPNCAFRLPPYCGNCGHIYEGPPGAFCSSCGTPTKPSYEDKVEAGETVAVAPDDMLAAFKGPGGTR
jgi:CHAT domain